MVDFFRTPAEASQAEIEVKRSRFLADVVPVTDEAQARAVVENARKAHWDARHHCSAFVLGPARDIRRSNDDGEPSGTAGMPMLDVLVGAEVTNVVAVVTRWFGGTLLGTGGLVKAYSDAVRAALEAAQLDRYERRELAVVELPVADVGRAENALRANGVAVRDVEYAQMARMQLGLEPGAAQTVGAQLASLLGREIVIAPAGEDWVRV